MIADITCYFQTESLSKKQVTDLRIAFSLFDKDGDGKITVGELKHVTQSMNISLDFRDVERMIRKFDKDGKCSEYDILIRDHF